MNTIGNFISGGIVLLVLYLIYLLTQRKKSILEDSNLDEGRKPLDEYEKDLNKIFDYSKIKTIPLSRDGEDDKTPLFEAQNNFNHDDFRLNDTDEKISGEDVPGPSPSLDNPTDESLNHS